MQLVNSHFAEALGCQYDSNALPSMKPLTAQLKLRETTLNLYAANQMF